jgi:predicted kinase
MKSTAPLLIVIQGAPASGKSTLARRLETDLGLLLVCKDDIKEFLFDRLPQSDRDFSTIQGKAAIAMMYAGATVFLKSRKNVMIESAFYTEFAKSDIQEMAKTTGAQVFEVFCFVDEKVRQKRFMSRVAEGNRHPGHLDHDVTTEELSRPHVNTSIDLGERFDVNTGSDDYSAQYAALVARLRDILHTGE